MMTRMQTASSLDSRPSMPSNKPLECQCKLVPKIWSGPAGNNDALLLAPDIGETAT